jgi:hypothetical protein
VTNGDPAAFFATIRPIEQPMTEADVVRALVQNVHLNPSFRMSFFELFGFGITDMGRKLFFSMSLCMELAEFRAHQSGIAWSVRSDEHRFIERYISFLVGQGLVYYDYSDYLIDRDKLRLEPTFLVPLTKRGQVVLGIMQELTHDLFHETLLALEVSSVRSILARLPAVQRVQQEIGASGIKGGDDS